MENKLLKTIAISLFIILFISIGGLSFYAYKLIYPKEEKVIVINYEELSPTEITTIALKETITTNLTVTTEDEMPYFAIVEMSYEVVNLDEYSKEATELINIMQNSEAVVRRIATSEIRKRTYKEMLTNTIYDELSNDILLKMQEEYGTKLICNVIIHEVIAG